MVGEIYSRFINRPFEWLRTTFRPSNVAPGVDPEIRDFSLTLMPTVELFGWDVLKRWTEITKGTATVTAAGSLVVELDLCAIKNNPQFVFHAGVENVDDSVSQRCIFYLTDDSTDIPINSAAESLREGEMASVSGVLVPAGCKLIARLGSPNKTSPSFPSAGKDFTHSTMVVDLSEGEYIAGVNPCGSAIAPTAAP